ncbi:MAG TPA: 8-amino-7-oxononanoate synthase [Polyangiaceae bacterium]|nr:8-amino-7-oxononanoate synthase [Polyangiaceae bacterium]
MSALRHLDAELERLKSAGLLRTPRESLPDDTLVLCSNDYLGYAREPLHSVAPSGAGASRLISGDKSEHRALESAIARWLECDAVLVFSSGYAAGLGAVAALAGPDDLVVSDELNHASLIDGCRLSRARVAVVPHLSADAVANALEREPTSTRNWVVTESYFSMDGNSPDLAALRRICDAHDAALVVDEAHALGVFGARGRGLCHAANVVPDVLIGTLGKALGTQGAFVAGSRALRSWLWNRARSFVFSTGLSPALANMATARVERAAADDEARARLHAICLRVRRELARMRVPIADSHGPVIPWLVGDAGAAVTLSRALLEHGVFVQAIRPPTVPPGSARLRLSLHARLGDEEIARLLTAVERVMQRPKLGEHASADRKCSPRAPDQRA